MTDMLLLPLKKRKENLLENSSFTYAEQLSAVVPAVWQYSPPFEVLC